MQKAVFSATDGFISDDRQTVYAQECYESSEAAAAHLRKFAAAFGQRLSAMVERKRFVVLGDPSNELRALLGIYRATYHRPFGSFAEPPTQFQVRA